MYRIFIVEDDLALADAMKRQIVSWGNEARCARDFQNIIPEFTEYEPHMILMDIMLPFYNGYLADFSYLCSYFRAKIRNSA